MVLICNSLHRFYSNNPGHRVEQDSISELKWNALISASPSECGNGDPFKASVAIVASSPAVAKTYPRESFSPLLELEPSKVLTLLICAILAIKKGANLWSDCLFSSHDPWPRSSEGLIRWLSDLEQNWSELFPVVWRAGEAESAYRKSLQGKEANPQHLNLLRRTAWLRLIEIKRTECQWSSGSVQRMLECQAPCCVWVNAVSFFLSKKERKKMKRNASLFRAPSNPSPWPAPICFHLVRHEGMYTVSLSFWRLSGKCSMGLCLYSTPGRGRSHQLWLFYKTVSRFIPHIFITVIQWKC